MAVVVVGLFVSTPGNTRGLREEYTREDTLKRDNTQQEFKEIHLCLISQSRTYKALIAKENELISNMFLLIHHLQP